MSISKEFDSGTWQELTTNAVFLFYFFMKGFAFHDVSGSALDIARPCTFLSSAIASANTLYLLLFLCHVGHLHSVLLSTKLDICLAWLHSFLWVH